VDRAASSPSRERPPASSSGTATRRDGQFADNARLSSIRIELGDRRFDADLLDIRGPQAVDLPEPVRTDRVRLTIMDVHAGRRYADVAVSGIEVRGPPAERSGD
jgi:hypothetical protein